MNQPAIYSCLKRLECSECLQSFDPAQVQTFCPNCKAPLISRYDLESIHNHLDRDAFSRHRRGMWRWHELLQVCEPQNVISLGEGDTPVLHLSRLGAELGIPGLSLKDESFNPTGSFKARGLAAAISKARELGVTRVIIPTAGNAGGALAAYAARAGMQASIFMPKDTPFSNIIESQIAGAHVELVDGIISDAARLAGVKAQAEGWFDVSTFKEPYRLEGKKVMGYEIAEALDWKLPDVIVYPTGGGTGLVGIWKAIEELNELGWLETKKRPRMVAVQAEGCAPVVRSVQNELPGCDFWPEAHTIASGLRVPESFADRLILRTIRESGGTAVAVSDQAILHAQRQLASTEGIFAAPEGAATLAGLLELKRSALVTSGEQILLLNTGTGLKYLDLFSRESIQGS